MDSYWCMHMLLAFQCYSTSCCVSSEILFRYHKYLWPYTVDLHIWIRQYLLRTGNPALHHPSLFPTVDTFLVRFRKLHTLFSSLSSQTHGGKSGQTDSSPGISGYSAIHTIPLLQAHLRRTQMICIALIQSLLPKPSLKDWSLLACRYMKYLPLFVPSV